MNDPVNLVDPMGNDVEKALIGRFNSGNGVKAHEAMETMTERVLFQPERSIFSLKGARNGGLFDLPGNTGNVSVDLLNSVHNFVNGRPDAENLTEANSAEYFDYKPITHKDSARLRAQDRIQQLNWEMVAAFFGKTLTPADTTKLFPKKSIVPGRIVGTNGDEFKIVLYPSETMKGIVYYDLVNTHQRKNNLESVVDSLKQNGQSRGTLPLPMLGPGFLFP